jgi:hypothetical protein
MELSIWSLLAFAVHEDAYIQMTSPLSWQLIDIHARSRQDVVIVEPYIFRRFEQPRGIISSRYTKVEDGEQPANRSSLGYLISCCARYPPRAAIYSTSRDGSVPSWAMTLAARQGSFSHNALTEQGDEPQLWLDYVPNNAAPIVFAIAFGTVFIAHFIHFVRHKGNYFWCWMLLGLIGLSYPWDILTG